MILMIGTIIKKNNNKCSKVTSNRPTFDPMFLKTDKNEPPSMTKSAKSTVLNPKAALHLQSKHQRTKKSLSPRRRMTSVS